VTSTSQSLLARYAPALLPLAVAILGPLQLYMSDNQFTAEEVWLFIAAAAAAAGTWAVPLLKTGWAGALKVGLNLLVVLAGIVIPLIPGNDWSFSIIVGIGLALLQAVAAEIGVSVRLDAQKPVIDSRNDPGVPTITSLDPEALRVVEFTTS
jgi:hypothetical protein